MVYYGEADTCAAEGYYFTRLAFDGRLPFGIKEHVVPTLTQCVSENAP